MPLHISQPFTAGEIYWFVNKRISSLEPHPHICLGIKEKKYIFMNCGTSQFEKKKRHLS